MPRNRQREVSKTDEQWRKELDPSGYEVLRGASTERAFTGEYWNNEAEGRYLCKGCGTELFASGSKFDAGCGWPSFYEPAAGDRIDTEVDSSHGMVRTEVLCERCGGHLGHVFPDGPQPTGLRYCINSAALKFDPDEPAS